MFDKFSQALALMREAFEDAQTGTTFLACVDLAAEVDGAQQVINAASAVQAIRVAQYAAREEEQDGTGAWAAVDDLAHRMHGDDPTRTLEQARADALVDLMLTNVQVSTTVTLMIPVQTVTVDEPDDALERDLLVGGQPHGGQPNGGQPNGGGRDGAALGYLNPLANTDDFGQPTPDPNPLVEPSWAQICAMGYEIPGIGVIGGDIVAGSWTGSTPASPGSCSTNIPAWSSRPPSPNTCPTGRCAASSDNATATAGSPAATATPNDANPTTSSRSPAAGQPRSGTWSACANTTTGSNTTPAGP